MDGNIVLIGFMACGKGRTARELHRQTGRYALDCDDLIESLTKMKIRKIFARHGEAYFRELERNTATWLERCVSRSVISTGGGFVSVPNLARIGVVVHLRADFDALVQAVLDHPNAAKKIAKRPLFQDLDKARELFRNRQPLYRAAADIEVAVDGRDSESIAGEIVTRLGLERSG